MGALSRGLSAIAMGLKKRAPQILIVAGVAGGVTATVIACKKTRKIDEVIEKNQKDIQELHQVINHSPVDTIKTYTTCGLRFVRHYAVPLAIGAASVAMIFGGAAIFKKRIATLAAAYAALEASYNKYRERIKALDPELDKKALLGVTEKEADKKDLPATMTTAETNPYVYIWDDSSEQFSKDSELSISINTMKITSLESYFTSILKARGYVFLNEILDRLDIQQTKAGQLCGWVWEKDNADGDNDIRISVAEREQSSVYDPDKKITALVLEFNCDGGIVNRLWN